ncbi:MAG: ABC transporter ATP-binding protein [Lentisphaeria bacterium]|nr:ABC transporter ATP-binding protein [Lentisphaeria bacterium]
MRKIINGLRFLLTPQDKWRMIAITLLLAVGSMLEIVGLGLVMPIVAVFSKPELLEQNKWLRLFRQLFSCFDNSQFLLICCLLLILLYIVKNIWTFVTIKIYTVFIFNRLSSMSLRIYSGFLHSPYLLFARHGKVGLLNIIHRVEIVCNYVLISGMTIFVDVLSILFICGVLAFTIPWVVLGCAVIFGVGSMAIWLPLRKINLDIGEGMNKYGDKLNKVILYSFEDIKTIKVAGCEDAFTDHFMEYRRAKSRYNAAYYVIGQFPRLALETVAVLSAVIVLMIMLLRGEAIGTVILSFSLLITAMARLLPAVSRINYGMSNIRVGTPAFEEVIDGLKWQNEDLGDPDSRFEFKNEIKIKDLEFSYPGSTEKIFSGLNLTIRRNESLAVTGPTGGGKSTFIDLLLGLYQLDSGSVEVDGKNIFDALGAWRKLIGFVPQHIVLDDASIAANVAVGCKDSEIDRERVMEVLKIAQLEDVVNALPEGMETVIGDNGMRLSGGQRQRIGIARALYKDPEIIIFDEATSALDSETEQALIDAVEKLHGRKTMIMVAHRLSTVEKCEKHIRIDFHGRD